MKEKLTDKEIYIILLFYGILLVLLLCGTIDIINTIDNINNNIKELKEEMEVYFLMNNGEV